MKKIKRLVEIERPKKNNPFEIGEIGIGEEINGMDNNFGIKPDNLEGEIFLREEQKPRKKIEDIYRKNNSRSKKRRSAFFWVIFIFLFILAIAVSGFWAYKKYVNYKKIQADNEKKSIVQALNEEREKISEEKNEAKEELKEEKKKEDNSQEKIKSPKEVTVSVLNGGAPAGSAGRAKILLEKAGYAKVEAGNISGENIAGVVIYYQAEFKKEADSLTEALKSAYPKMEIKPGATEEQKKSNLVVVLGK